MPLCVRVQVCPSLPSYGKSFGHRLGGESSRLSGGGGFLGIPGCFSLHIGVVAVPRCPCSYHRKIDPPLFFILHVILHNFFSLFQDPSLHCSRPSLSLPRLSHNSPLLLFADRFQPCYIHTQIWHSCYLGNLNLIWLCHCYGHLGTGGLASPHIPKLPYSYVAHVGYPTPKTNFPKTNHSTLALILLPVSN